MTNVSLKCLHCFSFFKRTCHCSTTPQAAALLSLALQMLFFFFQVGLSFSTCFNFTSLEVLALLRIKGGTELTPSFQLSINSEFSAEAPSQDCSCAQGPEIYTGSRVLCVWETVLYKISFRLLMIFDTYTVPLYIPKRLSEISVNGYQQ